MYPKPDDCKDVVAILRFEDVGRMPVIGYTITDPDGTIKFVVKPLRAYAPWDSVLKWRYLADLWPEWFDEENDEQP